MDFKKFFIKTPSAWIPILMSCAALVLVLSFLALFGVVHEEDEGAAAHIWQILMGGQVPIIGYLLLKYVTQKPKHALIVLAVQIAAFILACAPVFILEL